jgi:hypothetical protein
MRPLSTTPGRLVVVVHHGGSTGISTGAAIAAAVAAVLIVLCLAWALARWWAYEPHWLLTLRHSFAEAGLRLAALWGELLDWARLGH